MNQRKQNISRWYMLGLSAILVTLCLIVSIGTAYARYRIEWTKDIIFVDEVPVQLALGTMVKAEDAEEAAFVPSNTIEWREEILTSAEGESTQTKTVYALDVTVSNYLAETELADGTPKILVDEGDIQVKVRLIGSLDAWNRFADGTLVLRDGTLLKDGSPRELTATVTSIQKDTALYHSFGMGWEFRFLDEYGEELTWTLKGGQLSCQEFHFTIDATKLTGTSLLQLQFVGDRVEQ